jgi:hypothetical protein
MADVLAGQLKTGEVDELASVEPKAEPWPGSIFDTDDADPS